MHVLVCLFYVFMLYLQFSKRKKRKRIKKTFDMMTQVLKWDSSLFDTAILQLKSSFSGNKMTYTYASF